MAELGELAAAAAEAAARRDAERAGAERAARGAARRQQVQEDGVTAGLAVRTLVEVEKRLGTSVRPALAGATSAILDQLSDGRFPDVKLTNDFLPLVMDDGDHRPLSELSGGEQDLVALALRLAVADVVAARQGGGVGFLILDEIFGSQDPARRDTILAGLRGLRSRYGQIWCISHVGGLDDAADRVVEIAVDGDGVAYAT
jgi:exonuclease SbcC